MPLVRRNEPIASWGEGDYVQGYALVARKDVRHDRNGKEYVDLELADSSGTIAGKIWPDSPALKGPFDERDFVQLKGVVHVYRDQHQLILEFCRRTRDEDADDGFDPGLLVPTTPEDLDDLGRRFDAVYPGTFEHPALLRLCEVALERHGDALREHAAAKTVHHAYRGGLLEHLVHMSELALAAARQYPELDRDLLLLGVLFHDLGKLVELGPVPYHDYTLEGQLVGHVVLGRDLLLECCRAVADFPADLRLHLEHLVLSHHGQREYGSPVLPATPEALVLHAIDDLDSKLNQLRGARRSGGEVQYLRHLGRTVYFPARQTGE